MIIDYLGQKVHVYKMAGKGTIVGDPYGSPTAAQHPSKFNDDLGYKRITINGGIFYRYDETYYANGIEVSKGKINQAWDTGYDDVYGVGITYDFKPVFAKQRDLKNMSLRSAITANFGIMINGTKVISPKYVADYSSISGRTILGHNGTEWITISFAGVTGKTGLAGSQLYNLCKQVGCINAVCLDGGGSVYLKVDDITVLNTTRIVKNVFMLYTEQKGEIDMPLKLVVRKQTLALRKELKFALRSGTEDKCPFTGETHVTTRYRASGATLNNSDGTWKQFPVGTEFEIVQLIPNLQLDGWQWVKVKHNGIEYFAQYDSMAYSIEPM